MPSILKIGIQYFLELSFWSHLLLGPGCGCDLAGEELGCFADAVEAWLSEATDAILHSGHQLHSLTARTIPYD